MLCDLCPNVYLDTSSSNSWMRYEEAHMDLRTVFRRALDVAGPRRLLFGTDSSYFPRGWNGQIFDAQSKALYEIGIDGDLDFYSLPKRTAVINAFFSGDKVYDPAVYKSFRFSDRPLFNSRWDLILNTVSAPLDFAAYLSLLRTDGTMVNVTWRAV